MRKLVLFPVLESGTYEKCIFMRKYYLYLFHFDPYIKKDNPYVIKEV